MNFLKKFSPVVLGFIFIASSVFAQAQQDNAGTVTDHELKEFATVVTSGQTLQLNAQKKLQALIEKEGIKPERFQMIMMSKQNPSMADSINVTADEKAAMKDIQPKMAQMNQDLQQKVASLIENSELTRQRFQEISKKIQSDKDMAKRYQKVLMELNGAGNGGNG